MGYCSGREGGESRERGRRFTTEAQRATEGHREEKRKREREREREREEF